MTLVRRENAKEEEKKTTFLILKLRSFFIPQLRSILFQYSTDMENKINIIYYLCFPVTNSLKDSKKRNISKSPKKVVANNKLDLTCERNWRVCPTCVFFLVVRERAGSWLNNKGKLWNFFFVNSVQKVEKLCLLFISPFPGPGGFSILLSTRSRKVAWPDYKKRKWFKRIQKPS